MSTAPTLAPTAPLRRALLDAAALVRTTAAGDVARARLLAEHVRTLVGAPDATGPADLRAARLEAALRDWEPAADPAARDAVADALVPVQPDDTAAADPLVAGLHLGRLADADVPPAERLRMLLRLGWALDGVPAAERAAWLRDHAPASARALWWAVGRRRFAAHRAQVLATPGTRPAAVALPRAVAPVAVPVPVAA
ncbi:hypothetical protein [Cellulomonas marina]|uniref:Uncharacterized protein n=1 Tax=Cellulomonas marina TaxID=988821 RepID=A0A1I0XSH1_9CELL|nr:hypothetical protein [Cellulomonas marina]GIG30049.1 hypothetical protein Cma02nite_26490 [Cellulomonas marina]SFB02943.1 hypothetical protein SAMN05421867_105205 [Cellulomonas marina]